MRVPLLSHACNIYRSSYIPRFYHTTYTWCGAQIMSLLNQPSIQIVPVSFRNLSNHTTIEDSQSCFTLIVTDRFHVYTKHDGTL